MIEQIYEEINELIYYAIQNIDFVPSYSLLIYGSSVNGLAMANNSDLDLSLVIHKNKNPLWEFNDEKKFLDIS